MFIQAVLRRRKGGRGVLAFLLLSLYDLSELRRKMQEKSLALTCGWINFVLQLSTDARERGREREI